MADSGHGMPAALLTRALPRFFFAQESNNAGARRHFCDGLTSSTLSRHGRIPNVFLGVSNLQTRAGAGQPPALLVRTDDNGVERLHVSQEIVAILSDCDVPVRR